MCIFSVNEDFCIKIVLFGSLTDTYTKALFPGLSGWSWWPRVPFYSFVPWLSDWPSLSRLSLTV